MTIVIRRVGIVFAVWVTLAAAAGGAAPEARSAAAASELASLMNGRMLTVLATSLKSAAPAAGTF